MVIAYFSMEIALEDGLKNYAGGLGILAGDILKSAADLDLPFVGLTLLNNHGYFEQKVNENGVQSALPIAADRSQLSKLSVQTKIKIGDEEVTIGAWQYVVKGQGGATVPVYFLDTNLPENKEEFRSLTDYLYGGDQEYRLQQEIILGEGGVALLNALHYEVARYHLNEGHSALAALSLFLSSKAGPTSEKIAEVRRQCVFTTHTSVQAAQDIFPKELFFKYQAAFPAELSELINNNQINLTELGVFLSGSLNAVSNLHQKVVAEIFRERAVAVVTNGVHSVAWTAPEYKKLYDKYLPGWREKNDILKAGSSD